jgi:hydroxymethylbilane synthase
MALLRFGTRQSPLAQAQSRWVADRLTSAFPGTRIELVLIKTSGDKKVDGETEGHRDGEKIIRPVPPSPFPPVISIKATFTKELEDALLGGRIDFAVHSLKDVAVHLPAGLVLGAFPEREDPRDVWISKNKIPFHKLPSGARVATGALRRQAQLRHARPDLEFVPLRGNVETRLRKLEGENIDGIVLALAGLKRLGLDHAATEIFSEDVLLPAAGQGCLAIEAREDRPQFTPFLQALDHAPTRAAVLCERAFLRTVGGGCQTPIGAYARCDGERITLAAAVCSPDGKNKLQERMQGPISEGEALGERLAKRLLDQGAGELLRAR